MSKATEATAARDAPPGQQENKPANATASKVLFDDAHTGRTLGRFDEVHKVCKSEPPAGKVPGILPGKGTAGCDYIDHKDLPKPLKHLELSDIYSKVAPSVVRFDQDVKGYDPSKPKKVFKDLTEGTGVMVSNENGKVCLTVTNAHVVEDDRNWKILKNWGITSNGKSYSTDIRYLEKSTDTAVVALHTGDDTNSVCKPLTPSTDLTVDAAKGTPLVGFGFAGGSRALYVSPGLSGGPVHLRDVMTSAQMKHDGLASNAMQLHLKPYHMIGGQSGGPIVNSEAKWIALNDQTPGETRREGYGVLMDQRRVSRLIELARKKQL